MRLPASLRAALYLTAGVVALSGIAWLFGRYAAPQLVSRSFAVVTMEVHGGATMALLVIIGSAVSLHAGAAWREAKNRGSGTLLCALLIALALTGFLLYYAGAEETRSAASLVHWTLGLVALLVLAAHIWLGRRSRGG